CLSCGGGQCSCEPARDSHVIVLSVFVHSAQAKHASVHAGRRISRGHASLNRVSRGIRQAEFASMDTLRNSLSLAVSALHGDRLDVPRGLRSCRLPGAASWPLSAGPFRSFANGVAALSIVTTKSLAGAYR